MRKRKRPPTWFVAVIWSGFAAATALLTLAVGAGE